MIDFDAPLLHIGYHKTATTWLQEQVFDKPQIAGFHRAPKIEKITTLIARVPPLSFDLAATREALCPLLADPTPERHIAVISSERLSGHPYTGGYDSVEIANRLHQLFPRGRVLIVIREQRSMISSVYRAYVRDGGLGSLRRFMLHPGTTPYPHFEASYYQYDRLIRHYQQLFGASQVCVLAFEQFRRDPQKFASMVCEFAAPPAPAPIPLDRVNEGISSLAAWLKRPLNCMTYTGDLSRRHGALNRFTVKMSRGIDMFTPGAPLIRRSFDRRLKKAIGDIAGEQYRISNRAVMELTGLPLDQLGYDC